MKINGDAVIEKKYARCCKNNDENKKQKNRMKQKQKFICNAIERK